MTDPWVSIKAEQDSFPGQNYILIASHEPKLFFLGDLLGPSAYGMGTYYMYAFCIPQGGETKNETGFKQY